MVARLRSQPKALPGWVGSRRVVSGEGLRSHGMALGDVQSQPLKKRGLSGLTGRYSGPETLKACNTLAFGLSVTAVG